MSDRGIPQRHPQPVPSAAQARIISAALELFARNGVGGTSLQMIADSIGVTKAAVYHQYNSKEQIVLAAADAELASLESILCAAEAEPSRLRARKLLVQGMIDLAVDHRRTAGTILNDPVVTHSFSEHDSFRQVMDRISHVLMGDDIDHQARVSTAMITAAISGTVMHPLVAALDDDTLRSQLERLVRQLLPAMRSKPKSS